MRRTFGYAVLVLAGALTAAGCAAPGHRPGDQPNNTLTAAPIDAALVTATFGWVLTADDVLLTDDGGASFHSAPVDLPTSTARAAYFRDTERGWVAATDGSTISVARTADGGDTWATSAIRAPEPIGALSVGFGDGGRGALLATVQTSGAFSKAELFVTGDQGVSWTASNAPVAGRVAVQSDGRIWLAGGVLNTELYASADRGRSWSKPLLALNPSTTVDAVALPQDGILPVTVTEAGKSRVALFGSADGANWRETTSVPLATGTGGAAAVAVAGSTAVVADPRGNGLYRAAAGSTVAASAKGLPAGVAHLSFADREAGWALASSGSCAHGKQLCSVTTTLVMTVDGGAAWRPLLRHEEKL